MRRPHVPEEDARAFGLLEVDERENGRRRGACPDGTGTTYHWRDRNGATSAPSSPHDAELLTRNEVQENPAGSPHYQLLDARIHDDAADRAADLRQDARVAGGMSRREDPGRSGRSASLPRGAGRRGRPLAAAVARTARDRSGALPGDLRDRELQRGRAGERRKVRRAALGGPCRNVRPDYGYAREAGARRSRDRAATLRRCLPSILTQFYSMTTSTIRPRRCDRFLPIATARASEPGTALFGALEDFPPFNLLINETMKAALPLAELGSLYFPGVDEERADGAVTRLLALGSRARNAADDPVCLPCRIHSFFRGLPGLWVCMDPDCSELPAGRAGWPGRKAVRSAARTMRLRRTGARVFHLPLLRDVLRPRVHERYRQSAALWADPGHLLRTDADV